jgi:hypothetical protein
MLSSKIVNVSSLLRGPRCMLACVITVIGISGCSSSPENYGTSEYGVPTPNPTTAAGAPTLKVMNFLNWCSVAINGGAGSTDATVTASVTPGSVATIVAAPASSSFQIGAAPWFGVDENDGGAASGNDVGQGTTEMSKATVTITGNGTTQCVAVCCQEPGNGPVPCPTTNPCL